MEISEERLHELAVNFKDGYDQGFRSGFQMAGALANQPLVVDGSIADMVKDIAPAATPFNEQPRPHAEMQAVAITLFYAFRDASPSPSLRGTTWESRPRVTKEMWHAVAKRAYEIYRADGAIAGFRADGAIAGFRAAESKQPEKTLTRAEIEAAIDTALAPIAAREAMRWIDRALDAK